MAPDLTTVSAGGALTLLCLRECVSLLRTYQARTVRAPISIAQPRGCEAPEQIEALIHAMDQGFEQQREDNKAIRDHLRRVADMLQTVTIEVAVLKDRRGVDR